MSKMKTFFHFVTISTITISSSALAGIIERAPVGEKIAPFVQSGKLSSFAFSDGYDGTEPAIRYELHSIEPMLNKETPVTTFEIENGKPGNTGYFKAKYRAIYITKPLTASAIFSAIPIPTPSMFGNPVSNVYVMGVLLDTNSIAPKVTPWIKLDLIQLVIEK